MTRIIFMGSPAFAVPSLRALAAQGFELVAVVTQPDRSAGRGGRLREPAVKAAARELALEVLQPETLKDEEVVNRLSALEADAIVVAAYGKILPRSVLALPAKGSLNVHASILPRWRGASPIAAAILAGDRETGITIMEMVPKMDAGPVLGVSRLPIPDRATTGTLEPVLADGGARLLVELLPRWLAGDLQPVPQEETAATYCKVLSKEDAHLRADMTAVEAERAVRAYDPWPGAYVEYRGGRLAVWSARSAAGDAPTGSFLTVARAPAIAFREGLLLLDEVQLPGGRRTSGSAFLNGQRGKLEPEVVLAC